MDSGHLPPEAHIDLQIGLDRLRELEERCRTALRELVRGRLSRSAYLSILSQQVDAQRDWELRHRKYFADLNC